MKLAFARFLGQRKRSLGHVRREKKGSEVGLTLTVPSEEALMMWWPSGVKVASLTKEVWPRNSFSVLPDLRPWILKWEEKHLISESLNTFKWGGDYNGGNEEAFVFVT